MPKVRQKTSGSRGQPPSSDESDGSTSPECSNSAKNTTDQNRRGKVGQQKSSGKATEQNNVAESDSSEVPATPSVSETDTSGRCEKQFAQMSVQDRERLANDIVRFLLTADTKKHPIKQQDIKKHVLKDYSRAFNSLMKIAVGKLRTVFGIEVVDTEVGKQKAYMLVNTLDNKYDAAHQTWPDDDHANMGLVMVILSAIFMKGNLLSEDDLFDLLRRLGIIPDHPSETFGDIKQLIMTDFVRQGYLEVEREQGSDPPVHTFRWGRRAKAETSKGHAMDFICQVFGEDSPQRWPAQMHDMEKESGEAANTSTSTCH